MKNWQKSMLIAGLSGIIIIQAIMLQQRNKAYEDACNNKAYEDACHMSDLIRCYKDHLHTDDLIDDYGLFDELEGEFLHQDGDVNLEEYVWCY